MDENEIRKDFLQDDQKPQSGVDQGTGGGIIRKLVKKKYIWIAVGAIVGIILIINAGSNIYKAISDKKKKKKVEAMTTVGEAVPVKVYKVKRMDFKDTLPVLGTIRGYKEIPLKFQTSGMLESFNFEEGEKIQEGDIIANLEQKDALLKLKYAELELNSTKKMFDVGAIIKNALEKSKLEYESARSDLEKTNIYAVSDGVLATQEIDVGTYVTPNDKVGMFVDISRVYGEFDIIEKDVYNLKLGLKTEISVDAVPLKKFIGTIDVISPIIEGRTRTKRIKVEIKNRDGKLSPGMFARGLISVYEKKNALIIPSSGVKKKDDDRVVFVVHRIEEQAEDKSKGKGKKRKKEEETTIARDLGTVEIRKIEIGHSSQDRYEIEKGIEEGDLIAIEIWQDLQDKEKVEIQEVQEILY